MKQLKAYSFLDFQCAIVGPGGSFSLGSGAGDAKEGVSFEYANPRNNMTVGASGEGFHTLRADKSGHVTVRVLKTSPLNGMLSDMFNLQSTSAANWGQNTISGAHKTLNDVITCQQVAFQNIPMVTYAEDANYNEWKFDAIVIDMGLGK